MRRYRHPVRWVHQRTQLRLRFVVANNADQSIDNAFFAGPESNNAAIIKVTFVE